MLFDDAMAPLLRAKAQPSSIRRALFYFLTIVVIPSTSGSAT